MLTILNHAPLSVSGDKVIEGRCCDVLIGFIAACGVLWRPHGCISLIFVSSFI